ncbi:MAG: porin [Saprospiraceae bacterium]|nr:porin [Saprospiraceae bacterium]
MKQIWLCSICFFILMPALTLKAQQDSLASSKTLLFIDGYVDLFYVYDFGRPNRNQRQYFFYNHNRHQEMNLNHGFIRCRVENPWFRTNFALQAGTYVNDNYAGEPSGLKNIFEANIGLRLNKKNTLWIDAGIMPSYIGFESVRSFDNKTMTRSLVAENSPYYIAGAKLTYKPDVHWNFVALVMNGWQRIQKANPDANPSWGTQITYTSDNNTTYNWSSFLGSDDPGGDSRLRFFNNFYATVPLSERWYFIGGFDMGIQQESKGADTYDLWFGPVVITQTKLNKNLNLGFRAEYYQDPSGIFMVSENIKGFDVTGFSVNLDYNPIKNLLCRVEARYLSADKDIFFQQGQNLGQNVSIGCSASVSF